MIVDLSSWCPVACPFMPPHRRILIIAFSTGITAGLASSLSIEWMRYVLVVLIGVAGALFWQVDEIRGEAEKHVIRAVSHHVNNSLTVTMNRRYLDPDSREQIVDEELQRLPEKYQAALVLCYLQGKTRDEAAGILGLTPTAFRGRINREGRGLRGFNHSHLAPPDADPPS